MMDALYECAQALPCEMEKYVTREELLDAIEAETDDAKRALLIDQLNRLENGTVPSGPAQTNSGGHGGKLPGGG